MDTCGCGLPWGPVPCAALRRSREVALAGVPPFSPFGPLERIALVAVVLLCDVRSAECNAGGLFATF